MQYTIEKPYKIFTENAKKKFQIFNFWQRFRAIFEKIVFLKNGVAGMKRGPCPLILHSFFMEPNEEALLKVSLKNFHWFQSCKTPLFQKWP